MIVRQATRRALLACAIGCASLAAPRIAAAADPPPSVESLRAAPTAAWETAPHERRYGFTLGLSFGAGIGQAAGFPNDPRKIEKQSYYTKTGIGAGTLSTFTIGVAPTDWMTFNVGMVMTQLSTASTMTAASGFTFRLETFPLYSLGRRWRDLGTIFEGTVGSAFVTPKDDKTTRLIDGGGTSRVAFGAFFEAIRLERTSRYAIFGKAGIGPFIEGDYQWSESIRRGGFFIGLRTALYASPR